MVVANESRNPFDLDNICLEVLEIVRPLYASRKILNSIWTIHLSYLEDGWGSNKRLNKSYSHLVAKAIKFTSEGEVKLKLRQINPGIGIEVTDTGIGIAEDQIANIFESFTQASVGQQS